MFKAILSILTVFVLFYQTAVNADTRYSGSRDRGYQGQYNEYENQDQARAYKRHKVKFSNRKLNNEGYDLTAPYRGAEDNIMREHR